MAAAKKKLSTMRLDRLVAFIYNMIILGSVFAFFPLTSEVFEFNKIIIVYTGALVLTGIWIIDMFIQGHFIWRKTLLDYPLLLFLLTQTISTLFSIDQRTSILGYYSRFNGGLLSLFSYALLYWVYTIYMDREKTIKLIKILLLSLGFTSVWAIGERFGISISCILINFQANTSCWAQNVTERAFASFGQPNWLAAWIVMTIPLVWSSKRKGLLFMLGFSALLFTKSRSGLLGFLISSLTYWIPLCFLLKKYQRSLLTFVLLSAGLIIIFGTPYTKSIVSSGSETVVEGVTESADLRRIVWKGAIDTWTHNSFIGSGVETFAYSYFQYRPIEHNFTSEWNFIYNKAHNEYLNYAATTGTLGIGAYFVLILFTLRILYQQYNSAGSNYKTTMVALIAGYTGLLVTNLFGFSVVPTSLLFFLYPAIAIALSNKVTNKIAQHDLSNIRTTILLLVILCIGVGISLLGAYWYADYQYAQGMGLFTRGKLREAQQKIENAILLNPQPDYSIELSQIYKEIALSSPNSLEKSTYTQKAILIAQNTITENTFNIKLTKGATEVYHDLEYYQQEIETLNKLSQYAPTDPQIPYRIGLAYRQLQQKDKALLFLSIAISLKPNYDHAREQYKLLKEME